MQLLLLGEFVVDDHGVDRAPRAANERRLFAALAFRLNTPVSVDKLVEAVWGDAAPRTARNAIQGHIGRIRRILQNAPEEWKLVGAHDSYALFGPLEAVDVFRFRDRVQRARSAIGRGETRAAEALLREGLDAWRGSPLEEFDFADLVLPIIELEQLRAEAHAEWLAARVALGESRSVVGELRAACADRPFDETLRAQLALALYRCGCQRDALESLAAYRGFKADETGLDPSPALLELEGQILRQDRSLDGPASAEPRVDRAPPPPALGRFFGHDAELGKLARLVVDDRVPLVAVVGPPGAGKTRLVAQFARVHADAFDEVVWVAACPTHGAFDPLEALSETLGLAPEGDTFAAVAMYASAGRQLLVLDLATAACDLGPVLRLMAAAPLLQVVVVQRARLRDAGPEEVRVGPLALPAGPADVEQAPASALFLHVAQIDVVSDADRQTVADVCHRLDGLPGAIELVARRVAVEGLPGPSNDLRNLVAAHGSSPVVAALGAVCDTLPPPCRAVLARLAAFAAPWRLDDARLLCEDLDGYEGALSEVLDRWLVVSAGDGRFRVLNTVVEAVRSAGDDDAKLALVRRWAPARMEARARSAGALPLALRQNLLGAAHAALDVADPATAFTIADHLVDAAVRYGPVLPVLRLFERLDAAIAAGESAAPPWFSGAIAQVFEGAGRLSEACARYIEAIDADAIAGIEDRAVGCLRRAGRYQSALAFAAHFSEANPAARARLLVERGWTFSVMGDLRTASAVLE